MANYYRIKIDVTYTTTANATTALNSINAALESAGRSEVATRNSAQVYLMIPGIPTQEEAETITAALRTAWSSVARSYGKVSVVRTDAMT